MRTKLATVSAVALAMAVAAPAAAQVGQQPGVGPETRPGMTQPGQTLPGDTPPGAGTPGTPGATVTPGQPPAAPRAPGTARDPLTTPGAPGTTATPGQPPMQPGTPGIPQDPLATDPGVPDTTGTPGQPPAGAPGAAQDPLATDPGAAEAPLATDRRRVPGAGQPRTAAEPGVQDPLVTDPAVEDDADPGMIDEPLAGDDPDVVDPVVRDDAMADDPAVADADMERMTLVQMEDVLHEIGAEDVGLFFGSVVRASVEDGPRVVMLIGPEDFAPGEEDMAAFAAFDEVRGELEEAGFADVRQDINWYVMQGALDGHMLFAMEAADMGPDAALVEAGVETAEGEIDAEGLRDRLGEAGIEAEPDFEPKLFRAQHDGRTLFLLVGPEGMGAGSVELTEDDLRERFEAAGLSGVELVGDVPAVRGEHDGSAVVVIGDVDALRDARG
jgi:hypothetical protein